MQAEVDKQRFGPQRRGAEMAGLGQDTPEHQRRGEGEAADHRQRDAPVEKIGEDTAQQASTHAANRVTANIQSHRKRDKTWVDLFAQIGHPDRRHAA